MGLSIFQGPSCKSSCGAFSLWAGKPIVPKLLEGSPKLSHFEGFLYWATMAGVMASIEAIEKGGDWIVRHGVSSVSKQT